MSCLRSRSLRLAFSLVVLLGCLRAEEPTASQVAHLAREAEKAGLIVRAWELYGEAARMDPSNTSYRARRDALESSARLLRQFNLQSEEKGMDELDKQAASVPTPATPASHTLSEIAGRQMPAFDPFVPPFDLQPPPSLRAFEGTHSFDERGDEKALYAAVSKAFGLKVIFDPAFQPKPDLHFQVDNVDFKESLEALTAATNTFLFAVNTDTIFAARDDTASRTKFEPEVALTIPLPDAVDPKDLTDAATAVKGLLQSQRIMLDSATRTIVIRDRVSRAYIARALFESLILPKPQVSLGFQLLELNESVSYHYGLGLPTSYPVVNLSRLSHFQQIVSAPAGFTEFLAFGSGPWLFGVGITNTNLFAISSKSWTRTVYDGAMIAGNGQPATLKVGEKYPVAQALSSGYSQGGGAQVVPQTTQEDLGISIKATPHIFSSGDVMLDLEISYQTLGPLTLNSVPEIDIREYKGSVHLMEGESAVIAGMDSESLTVTRTGVLGLADIPWLNHILAENTRSKDVSRMLIVLKPVVTRPPSIDQLIAPFGSGGENGERVLL